MVANLIPDSQPQISGYVPDPRRAQWLKQYHNTQTGQFNVAVKKLPHSIECAVCGELISGDSDFLAGLKGQHIDSGAHLCEYVCNPVEEETHLPKVMTYPAITGSEIEDALALQRAKLVKPDFPVNWEQHKAKFHTPTTPEFMDVLDEIEALPDPVWYDDSLADNDFDMPWAEYIPADDSEWLVYFYVGGDFVFDSLHIGRKNAEKYATITKRINMDIGNYVVRLGLNHDQPQPAPATEPDDEPQPVATKKVILIAKKAPESQEIIWTVAEAMAWIETRDIRTRADFELGKIDKKRATEQDIMTICTAIRRLGGERYPQILDELTVGFKTRVRLLRNNSDEDLMDMLRTVNRKLRTLAAQRSASALGDNQCRCMGKCRCGKRQDAA